MLPLGRSTSSRLGARMEAAGIEPASRERRHKASTRLFRLLISLKDAPTVRIIFEPVR